MVHAFTVADMSCQHCVASITSAVSKLEGVDSVAIDLNQHRVQVQTQPSVAAETIIDAINDAGYTEISAATPAAPRLQSLDIPLNGSTCAPDGSCC